MASFAQLNAMANDLPEGRYALPGKVDGEVWFFEIKQVNPNIPTGQGHRIYRLTGAPSDFKRHTMKISWQETAMRKIRDDVAGAMQFFGKTTRTCGACTSPLTHKRSRDCGMGPKCAPKWGVKW